MKAKIILILVSVSLVGGWLGYKIWYLNSDYCDVLVSPAHLSEPEEHYREFIYRIGDTDFIARFPHAGLGNYGGLVAKKGPVPRSGCAAEWSN